jgi:hypothetical protein
MENSIRQYEMLYGLDRESASIEPQLGWITDAIGAGAGIFNTIYSGRTESKSNQSEERQLQLQLQAQREGQAGMLKMLMIGGGVLIAGGIVIAIIKSNSSDKSPTVKK